MDMFTRMLGCLNLPFLLAGIVMLLRHPKKDADIVVLSRVLPIIGMVASTFFTVLTFLSAFDEDSGWAPFAFFAFSMLGNVLIVAYCNCRIWYDEDGFTVKTFFGIKRRYRYAAITAIRYAAHETYLYIGKHRVMIDEMATDTQFLGFAQREYRRIYKGQSIPERKTTQRFDPFRGNISDAGVLLFVYILVGAIAVGFLVFVSIYVFAMPFTESNTTQVEVVFESFKFEDNTVIMTNAAGDVYKIRSVPADFDTVAMEEIANSHTLVTVYCDYYENDNGTEYALIRAIREGDRDIFSFEESSALHTREYWPLIPFVSLFPLAWGAYIAFSIVVGRNPRKYRKIIHWFFKPEYVRFR
ncbi:MAG: hypothetical protein J6B77_05685 [Clostridia bacterium]|nr:hypothetical protein [Clostridia bacterium]